MLLCNVLGWYHHTPLVVTVVDEYLSIQVSDILSFIPQKIDVVVLMMSIALRLVYFFSLWMHQCVIDSYALYCIDAMKSVTNLFGGGG